LAITLSVTLLGHLLEGQSNKWRG